jgi:hypothetical protein
MPVLTKDPTLGDLLKYELNGNYTREVVTLKGGTAYPLGAVLGRITASGIHRLSPAATVTGDEGAETAVAMLIEAVDATSGAATGVVGAVPGSTSEAGPAALDALLVDVDGAVEPAQLEGPAFDDIKFAGAATVRAAFVPVSLCFTTPETPLS